MTNTTNTTNTESMPDDPVQSDDYAEAAKEAWRRVGELTAAQEEHEREYRDSFPVGPYDDLTPATAGDWDAEDMSPESMAKAAGDISMMLNAVAQKRGISAEAIASESGVASSVVESVLAGDLASASALDLLRLMGSARLLGSVMSAVMQGPWRVSYTYTKVGEAEMYAVMAAVEIAMAADARAGYHD